ncbi:PQQ-binding-like beta-propeller repeat protein [Embleya sp. NPDC005575]|uniref:outer membrane protein assembly factor BamB family protein n=1 Tax=Embleya sp. NPDC005575 TaxID=3156892 RepID=UPI0033B5A3E0
MKQSAIPVPQIRWQVLPKDLNRQPSLYAADGRVYGTLSGTTFARDAATGRVVWEKEFHGTLEAIGEHIGYQSDLRRARAIDLRDGAELWSRALRDRLRPLYELGNPIRLPRRSGSRYISTLHETTDGTLIVLCQGAVFALDGTTGRLLWGRRNGHSITGSGLPDRAGPVVFARYHPTRMFALDVATGAMVWTKSYQPIGLRGERLLVTSSYGNALRVVDGATGEHTRYVFAADPFDYVGAYDDIRIAGTREHVLVASSASRGALWSTPIGLPQAHGRAQTHITDGVVHAWNDRGDVRAFDAGNGALLWSAESPWASLPILSHRRVNLIVDESVCVLTTDGGYVAALARTDGCPLWAWADPHASPDAGPPDVTVDRAGVYVATKRSLLAFDTPPHSHHTPPTTPRPRRVVGMEPPLRRTHRLTTDPRLRDRGGNGTVKLTALFRSRW